MLFTLLKELVDRFIEFLLHITQGETPEARLTSVLKSTVFLISVLVFALISVGVDNFNLRFQLKDYESVASKVGFLLNPENASTTAEEINKLSASIDANSNALRKENNQLTETNVSLMQENYWLQLLLKKQLHEMKRVKANNDALLQKYGQRKPN